MAEPRLFYQDDCNLSLLEGKTIAIIGYGSQGHAHAIQDAMSSSVFMRAASHGREQKSRDSRYMLLQRLQSRLISS